MANHINTVFLNRCIATLEKSYNGLLEQDESIDENAYDIYRNSVVKAFEMTIEQSAKLLRKVLKPYFASSQAVYKLTYKELFKYALQHGLLEQDLVQRWFIYRDNRNDTAHNYGEYFANETLHFMEQFIKDAKVLARAIEQS